MRDSTVHLQPAYILHAQRYKETSLLLHVLTRDFGKIIVLAKGVKKLKSKTAGILQAFKAINISYIGNNDLKTLTHVELIQLTDQLTDIRLYCGFYLNELVQHFLYVYDPHPEVFFDYQETLSLLHNTESIESTLRFFEYNLLQYTGYGLPLLYDAKNGSPVRSEKFYQFDIESGVIENITGPFSGEMLIALNNKSLYDQELLKQAKLLLRSVIDYHINYKKLHSRLLIKQHFETIRR